MVCQNVLWSVRMYYGLSECIMVCQNARYGVKTSVLEVSVMVTSPWSILVLTSNH